MQRKWKIKRDWHSSDHSCGSGCLTKTDKGLDPDKKRKKKLGYRHFSTQDDESKIQFFRF